MAPRSEALSLRMSGFLSAQIEGLPRIYWVVWAGTLVNRLGSLVMPMLTMYLKDERGLSLTQAGQVVALYGLGSLGGNVLGGVLADRIGRRPTLLGSLFLGAAAMLGLGLAKDLPQLMAGAFALGLLGDAARPAMQAVVADVVPARDRLRAFSLWFWAINLGFGAGAALAGVLANVSFTAIFVGDAITTLVFAGLVLRFVPETRPARAPDAPAVEGAFWSPLVDRHFGPFLFANFLLVLVFAQHQVALPAAMLEDHLGPSDYGFLIASNGVMIVLFQQLVTPWVKAKRRGVVLLWASALTGLGFGLGALAHHWSAWLVTVLVWTAGEILMAPVNASIVADLSPAHMRGRYQGAHSISWALAVLVAPLLGPRLAEARGFGALWGLCLGLGLAAGLVHLGLGPARRRFLAAGGASAPD